MHQNPSQRQQILKHLEAGKNLTTLEALKLFGCIRLGSRIHELRTHGHPIQTEMVLDSDSGKRYARYWMEAV